MIDHPHPKARALPIGIANSMWGHGDAGVVAVAAVAVKTNLCYVNFNEGTNHRLRSVAWVPAQHFGRQPNLPFNKYIELLSKFKFCVCPEGNGSDTHRMWEALYLGVIPIVLSSNKNSAYWAKEGIPMVVVGDWTQVTPEFLNLQSASSQRPDILQLRMSYWRDEVHAIVSTCMNK